MDDVFEAPKVVPSVGVLVQEMRSPFLCADAGNVADVVVLAVPLMVQVVSKSTVSPSASVDAPGVHVNVSVVLGESGDKEVLVRVGAALRMVTLAVAVGPSEMPSVGVTFTVHRSDFVVVLLGRTEVVLAEDTTPFSSHSYRYVTLPHPGQHWER